jgi:hypothetical protein
MSKFNKETPQEIARISIEMVKSCKNEIMKFEDYHAFLCSVGAEKRYVQTLNVLKFDNSEMPKYEDMFIIKFIHGLNDHFVFDKYARHWRDISETKVPFWVDTGEFIPRSFWDFVYKYKV